MKIVASILLTILFCISSNVVRGNDFTCANANLFCEEITYDELTKRNGVYYKKYSSDSFTGNVTVSIS